MHTRANIRGTALAKPTRGKDHFCVSMAALGLLALLAFDIWALHPFLTMEFRRLEPWKIALLCVGDCTCLMWFLWYFVQHVILCDPLCDKPIAQQEPKRVTWFYVSTILGLLFDLSATIYFGYRERGEYDDAILTSSTVQTMNTYHASKGLNWRMICRFRASDGRDYDTVVRLHLTPGDPFPETLSPKTVAELQAAKVGMDLPIRYDRAWPARAWLDGVPDDDNGLMWFSIAAIAFQGIGMLIVGLMGWKSLQESRKQGMAPWWLDINRAIPAALQIVAMAYWGALMRMFD
jgi:hypothetical protein